MHFQSITINNGLSQGFISSITQDRHGLMWFATSDGLNRYDGYNFTVYHHDADDRYSIGSDDLTCVFEDSRKRLWIGTRNNGLDYFDRENNRFYHIRDSAHSGLISNSVSFISEDAEGALWITTESGIVRMEILSKKAAEGQSGFFDRHHLRFTAIRADRNVSEKTDNGIVKGSIFTDSRGHNSFVTNSNIYELTFTAYNNYTFRKRGNIPVRETDFISGILENVKGKSLVTNSEQIIVYRNYNLSDARSIYKYQPQRAGHFWTIDNNQGIWTNEGTGMRYINLANAEQHYYVPVDTLQHEAMRTVTCMFSDRNGVLWVGTGGYGILKYDPEIERFHKILPGTKQYQLVEIRPGVVMTNTFEQIVLKKNKPPQYSIDPFLKQLQQKFFGRNLLHIAKGKDASFWVPDGRTLYWYDLDKKLERAYVIERGKKMGSLYMIYADKQAQLWFSFGKRFNRFLPSTARTVVPYPPGATEIDEDFIQTIYEDGKILWLGTKQGLFRFNTENMKMDKQYFFDPKDAGSLSNNFIFSICNDIRQPGRYLWVGTKGGGLNRLDKLSGIFTRYSTKNGLANNVVYGILPGDDGNLWLSTNKGLSAFDPQSIVFRNYDEADGLQSNEFNRYAYCKTSEGLLVFGGMNGINYFDPRELKPLPPPAIVFTEFRLFNRKVDVRDPAGPLKIDINYASQIRLRYEQNMITFQFAGMDFRRQGNIHYRYKMDGFDRDWVYGGTVHEATYTNLAPGTYTFSVQGSFDNIAWGTGKKSIQLIILTPWYRAWWFYLSIALTCSLLIYAIYRFRIYQLQRIDKLRDRIARDLHDEVGSSISTISIYSRIMQEQASTQSFDNRPLIDKINVFAGEIMESMNDIVWNINTRNDSFERIVSKMREHAFQLLEPRGYQVFFNVDSALASAALTMEKRREFYLIYKEALNNLAKYAAGSKAWISLSIQQNAILLTVKDNGIGFDTEVGHPGNGLNNMRQRAAILKGTFSIESEIGKGTQISLFFNVASK